MSRATLEADMRDHPKWLSLSPLAYRLGVRLVLWAVQHSRGTGFVPAFVVREYAGTKTMAAKLTNELKDCGKKFGRSGVLDSAEGGYVVHDLLTGDEPEGEPRRPLTKAEAGRLGGQASVEARKAASGSASPKQSGSASGGASGVASGSTGQAALDLTCQEDSASSSKTSGSYQPDSSAGLREARAEAKPAAPRTPRRWRFMPRDWVPLEVHRRICWESGVDIDAETAKLMDHEFKDPKSDPDKTAANWYRNARPTLPPRKWPPSGAAVSGAADLAARRAEAEARVLGKAAP